jgi:ATP-dependent Clp protease protease subunit
MTPFEFALGDRFDTAPLGPGPIEPTLQRYRDYARQRQMTLSDLLLENRIIFLEGPIDNVIANHLIKQFLYLQFENRTQGISFYINSPGGSVYSTLAVYDTMQFVNCPIATYCIGMAASGAAVLLAGGTKGKRFSLPHSKIMIHQPSGYVGGQVSDIEIQADEILKNKKLINEILAKHTGQPYERIAKDTERDRYLTAAEAKEYGLVDEVLSKVNADAGKTTGFTSPIFPSGSSGSSESGGPTPGAGAGTRPG